MVWFRSTMKAFDLPPEPKQTPTLTLPTCSTRARQSSVQSWLCHHVQDQWGRVGCEEGKWLKVWSGLKNNNLSCGPGMCARLNCDRHDHSRAHEWRLLEKIKVQTDQVGRVESVLNSDDGESAKGMECRQYSCFRFFYGSRIDRFIFRQSSLWT